MEGWKKVRKLERKEGSVKGRMEESKEGGKKEGWKGGREESGEKWKYEKDR